MSFVVGIDLGTTNSCVAVPAGAEIPGKDALIESRRLRPLGGALIVTNPDLSSTTPSVVWIDEEGRPVVGTAAKRKARLPGAPPAMFFKRTMGTDQLVTAGHRTLTPREASAHVLRHLKTMVRDAIGVPIDRAVVTVPAFFETRAKNETTQAGAEAGLEVVETLIEPVAAALAYMRAGVEQPMRQRRFLVYDLGGGTFDTSVVSWDDREGFTSRSFDGDRFLGGYDFDRAIVDWIVEQVPSYDLRLAGGELLSRLLAVAEAAKHDLTREAETDVIIQDLEDRAGQLMNINITLGRRDFHQLIERHLRDTIGQCDQALARARLTAPDLDEIVLVGGSSRIPLVAELLHEHYGIRPRLSNPELCVAVGAALKAETASSRSGLLELDNPEPIGSVVDISGRVLREGPLESATEIVVALASDKWAGQQPVREQLGDFLFIDVPLTDGGNGFTIRILADGKEVAAERIDVSPTGDPTPHVDGDVLAHDFSVPLVDGALRTVVKAGTKLPHIAHHRFETASAGSALTVSLYEGRIKIGTVTIPDLPANIPPGTGVDLNLEFEIGWTIRASVRLPHLDLATTAVIDIPIRQIPPWPDIQEAAAQTKAKWATVTDQTHPAEAKNLIPALNRRLEDLDAHLAKQHDQAKAHYLLLEAQTILHELSTSKGPGHYLKPSWADFEQSLATLFQLRGFLKDADPKAARTFQERHAHRRTDGQAAYDTIDQTAWRLVNNKLEDDIREVFMKLDAGGIPIADLPADQLQAEFQRMLDQLDQLVRTRYTELTRDDRLGHEAKVQLPRQRDHFLTQLTEVGMALGSVDLTLFSAREELRGLYRNHLHPLEESIKKWGPISLQ